MRRTGFGLMALVLTAGTITAADVESGPKEKADIPALKVTFATGTHEGKEIDLPGERKDAATVYLFITSDKFDRPVARFIKELDGKLGTANDKAVAYAVWVGGEAERSREYLPRVNQSLKFEKTELAWTTDKTPEGWGLNDEASLTVVVAKEKKAAKVFAWRSVNETDVKNVLEALK